MPDASVAPRPEVSRPPVGEDLRAIATPAALQQALARRRRLAARGTGRSTISLDTIARRSGLPRSTVHSYLSGVRLPPSDALDRIVLALGVEPAEQRAWADALQRVVEAPPSTDVRPRSDTSPVPRVPRELPRAPRDFVGRTEELRRLDQLAAVEEASVIRLTGPAGAGKTALALTWAHAVADAFPDGQVWVDLRGFGPEAPLDPRDAVDRVLHSIGVPTRDLAPDLDSQSAALRTALAGRRVLVVLDDARDTSQVRPVLAGTPGVVTLVTSRSELRSLGVVESAPQVRLRPVPLADGVAMLQPCHLVAAGGLDPHPVDLVEDLARRCAGLPLALRVLRERLATTSTARLRDLVDSLDAEAASDRLAELDVFDGEGEHGVRAALQWSYETLEPEPAALLRRLPLTHSTQVDLETAAALLGRDLPTAGRTLDRLVGASLLEPRGGGRFVVHDLTAAFARSRRGDDPDEEVRAARQRVGAHLTAVAVHAARLLRPTDGAVAPPVPPGTRLPFDDARGAFVWVSSERQALAAVVSSLLDERRPAEAFVLAETVARALLMRSRSEDVGVLLDLAARAAELAHDAAAEVVVHRYRGIDAAHHGALAAATRSFRRALEAAERCPGPSRLAKERGNLGYVLTLTGHLAEARALQLAATADTDDPSPKLPGFVTLARLDLHAADVGGARRWLDRAWAGRGSGPVTVDHVPLLEVSAVLARREGDLPRHDAVLRQLAEVVRRDGSTHLLAVLHVLQAERALLDPATDAARRAAVDEARAALALPAALVPPNWTVRAHLVLAAVAGRRDPVAARSHAHVAATVAAAQGLRALHAEAVLRGARFAADAGDLDAAWRDARLAREIARAVGEVTTLREADDVVAAVAGAARPARTA